MSLELLLDVLWQLPPEVVVHIHDYVHYYTPRKPGAICVWTDNEHYSWWYWHMAHVKIELTLKFREDEQG